MIKIGENKKIVAISESNSNMVIGFQDLQLHEEDKPSFFIIQGETSFGPFDNIQKRTIESNSQQNGSILKTTTYFTVTEKGKEYILYEKYKFGPFKSAQLLKANKDRIILVDYSEKGTYYEILSIEKDKPKLITRSDRYKDEVTGIYVSDNMDILMSFDDNSGNASHYFIYKGQKTNGFYHAVHFKGWMNSENDVLAPVFYCVAPLDHETYDVTNDLYVGNRLIGRIVAVLYDFSFNNTNTDFVVKGYTASRDGASIYSANSVLGPYDAVNSLEIDSLNEVRFEYEKNEQQFLYENQISKPIPTKEDYDWKNISPNGTDY
ncbi:MAG: hypothetical protein COA38_12460, partial [Fluviicola sp.]